MTAMGFTVESGLNLDQTINDMIDKCIQHYEFTPTYLHYPKNLKGIVKVVKGVRRQLDTDLSDSMIVLSDSKNF